MADPDKSNDTRVGRYILWLKNNKLFAILILIGIVITSLSTVIDAINKVSTEWNHDSLKKNQKIDSVNTINEKLSNKEIGKPSLHNERPDLSIKELETQQKIPLAGQSPKYKNNHLYCEALQTQLLISHNQGSQQSIRVWKISFESMEEPQSLSHGDTLKYTVDADKLIGYGIINVNEYILSILGPDKVSGQYLYNRKRATKIDPENIFISVKKTQSFSLEPSGADSYLQLYFNVELKKTGLYKFRFNIYYDTPDSSKVKSSPWLYMLRQ
jgi:hypothetical protein